MLLQSPNWKNACIRLDGHRDTTVVPENGSDHREDPEDFSYTLTLEAIHLRNEELSLTQEPFTISTHVHYRSREDNHRFLATYPNVNPLFPVAPKKPNMQDCIVAKILDIL